MKICLLPNNLDVHHTLINATISNCLYIFSSEPPHSNLFFDLLSSLFLSLFFVFSISLAITFMILKKRNKIVCQFKESYLIITLLASFFHVISIFMTYGFWHPAACCPPHPRHKRPRRASAAACRAWPAPRCR